MGGNLHTKGLTYDTLHLDSDANSCGAAEPHRLKVSDYKTTSGTPMDLWYNTNE